MYPERLLSGHKLSLHRRKEEIKNTTLDLLARHNEIHPSAAVRPVKKQCGHPVEYHGWPNTKDQSEPMHPDARRTLSKCGPTVPSHSRFFRAAI